MALQHSLSRARNWALAVLIALDILGCALTGGAKRQTISGRCGRAIAKGNRCILCRPLCWVLNRLQRDHCANCAAEEPAE